MEDMMEKNSIIMGKFFSIAIACAVSLLVLDSCSKGSYVSKDTEVELVSFFIDDYRFVDDNDEESTRTSFIEYENGITYVWSDRDTVGIYPTSGSQIYFVIDGANGETYADFDGGGWAFKTSSKYYSYYPFIGNIYLDREKIPVSYVGQKQVGISSKDHIGYYDYMYTPACSSNGGMLNFSYKHLGCIFRFNLKQLPVGNYTKLAITAPSEVFVKTGSFNILSNSPAIVGNEYTKQLVVDLENINITELSDQVYVYLLSAPVSLKGVEVIVSVLNDQKTEFQCRKTLGKDYKAQVLYGIKCEKWTEVKQSVDMLIDPWDKGGNIGGDAQ